MRNKKVKFITRTAIFIALLLVLQFATASMGQFVTGSMVNLVLIVSCLSAGTWTGIMVAIISPFAAKLFGIGPALIQIIPAIAAGNLVYVLSYGVMKKINFEKLKRLKWIVFIVIGAVLKYIVLSILVTSVVLPLSNIPSQMGAKLTAMFGINQLITALIGGFIAMIIVPLVKRGFVKN